ncbi:hypothetical protein DID88_006317 [Monilinia fructigena]|uniref:FAD/NAD(P)-binding domain-containing protein n=1 Tax=Monilinia fructigena TaxID=38457 RepID=A0A395J3B2_9HELO|nr:hypothetical protein DID88_006317 [Monilinia fructigena]
MELSYPLFHPFLFLYQVWQFLLAKLLSPSPPIEGQKLGRPKIAIIGAGLTGVSAASHCVGHGFDVQIFEAGPRSQLGGIWSFNGKVVIQINNKLYLKLPNFGKLYGLEKKTKFDTKVEKVYQDEKGRWIINNTSEGRFEGIIAAVGTCGDAKIPHIPGMDKFKGEIYHSSELTGKDAKGKKIIVIGGGASAVEALEFATHEEAASTTILARSDKWIIPRNAIVDMLLALNIFGQETFLSWIPETLLKKFFYRDLEDLAPTDKGIFTGTPMVNSDVMDKIREGKVEWLRGDIKGFTEDGIKFNLRAKGVPAGGPGKSQVVKGDIVVMATGFDRPSLDFFPSDTFKDPYSPPNWYLPNIPSFSSLCNWHIGIYTRILLMFLSDPLTRPNPFWMERWIDMTRFLKRFSPTGAFDFFTYLELVWWFTFCIAVNPFRWKWAVFVFTGIGRRLPRRVVEAEDSLRRQLGWNNGHGADNRDKGASF